VDSPSIGYLSPSIGYLSPSIGYLSPSIRYRENFQAIDFKREKKGFRALKLFKTK